MVQVMYAGPYGGSAGPNESSGIGPTTLVHIHSIERHVAGNGIKLVVYGEMKIAAGQYVYAKDLKLGTVQQLLLTPELNLNNRHGYMAQKYIYHKGELGNYASVDIYDDAATFQAPGTGPVDGSIWLDFEAIGED
jgi:hypothetical protein